MRDVDITFLNDFIKKEECYLQSFNSEDIQPPFDIMPKDFLNYAEYDLNSEYNHNLINSLSNIKRAIDCQLASLFYAFGLLEKLKTQKWNFPDKIDCLNKLGVISPRILLRINRKRNLLEHEYIRPNKNEVEDALDVAILFNAYTEKFLLNAMIDCEPYNDEKKEGFEVKLDYKNNRIILYDTWDEKIIKEINANSEDYLIYLKWYIDLYKLKT